MYLHKLPAFMPMVIKKINLYFNDLMPERFGRQRKYALGKTSGKANIENNLQQLGIQLSDDDLKKVTQRIIELGDRKEVVTQADLPYIISDILDSNTIEEKVQIRKLCTYSFKRSSTFCYIENFYRW